jgi:hypothetical protein
MKMVFVIRVIILDMTAAVGVLYHIRQILLFYLQSVIFYSYLYIKASKSIFNVPREKLRPRQDNLEDFADSPKTKFINIQLF